MRREDLEQLRALKQEIETLTQEYIHLPEERVTDTYGDYSTGRRKVKQMYTDRKKGGAALEEKIRAKADRLTEKVREMETWLDGIEDSEVRDMLRLYYVAGMTLREIGERKGYDRTSVRKKMNRWWSKHSHNSR